MDFARGAPLVFLRTEDVHRTGYSSCVCLPETSHSFKLSEHACYGTTGDSRTGSSYRPNQKELPMSWQLGGTRKILRSLKAAQDDAAVMFNLFELKTDD